MTRPATLPVFTYLLCSCCFADVVINEIHYEPAELEELSEFIELHNTGDTAVDMAGWALRDGVTYTFPEGALIDAAGYLVIARNVDAVRAAHGVAALGPWEGRLSNKGERVELEDAEGKRVDVVEYGLAFPWPTGSAGGGGSMELINPSLDNDLGGSWRYSQPPSPLGALTYITESSLNWSYRPGDSEASDPVGAWRGIDFAEGDDWLRGQTPIGFARTVDTDGPFNTFLDGMQSNYSSLYLRHSFEVAPGELPSQLLLRYRIDDGVIIWINGVEVERFQVDAGEAPFSATANGSTEVSVGWREVTINGGALVEGKNVISAHAFNSSISGSDFSVDVSLERQAEPQPEPQPTAGRPNSTFSANAPPQARQVNHTPKQPKTNEPVVVSAKVTDPDGVARVTLLYQIVEPGNYIRSTDEAFEANWIAMPMTDADGDDVFEVTMPTSVQVHRRLIRYRIEAEDSAANSVRVPYADDPALNFAYFVYDGAPAWTGSFKPGGEMVTFTADIMNSLPIYHLIGQERDIRDSQYTTRYNDGVYRFLGTMVHDGEVYDHMSYRIRGHGSTYNTGKNKWKLRFNSGHYFKAHDNYGRPRNEAVKTLNWSALASPWNPANRGMAGLDEAVAFRLWQLTGTPAANTNYFHLRIIDDAVEQNPDDQYDGDNWGLYLTIEQTDKRFLDERGLPDGNTYNMHFGDSNVLNQAPGEPATTTDLRRFYGTSADGYNKRNPIQPVSWWDENIEIDHYFSYRAVVEAVNHSDLRDQENSNYYHNPVTGKWTMIPWDVDLLYEEFDRWGPNAVQSQAALEQFRKALDHPELNLRFQNRVRELQDLLLNEDQGWALVDEFAHVLGSVDGRMGWAELDAYRWEEDPRSRAVEGPSTNSGSFFVNPYRSTRFPSKRRELVSGDFAGMMQWVKDFIVPTGFGGGRLNAMAEDQTIPDKPVLTYAGADGFPLGGIVLQSSSFASPSGETFQSMQWRLGEIRSTAGEPYIYEIEPLWNPEPQDTFAAQVTVPTSALVPGRTYRARVRHQDASGRWSHWSDPVQFAPAEPDLVRLRADLVISEIMYDPASPSAAEMAAGFEAADFEFVELHNRGEGDVDLASLRFTKGIDFDFALLANPVLTSGQTLVIARNADAFALRYGFAAAAEWGMDKLANGGELLKLSVGAGLSFIEIDYNDAAPWPVAGSAGSIELSRITATDTTVAASWRRSALANGSPGTIPVITDGQVPVIVSLQLDETIATLTIDAASGSGEPQLQTSADLVLWVNQPSTVSPIDGAPSGQRYKLEYPLADDQRSGYLFLRTVLK
ncbi:MAG: lamin tail domain-containing protein [Verrucomicrobiales bacterium]